MKPPSLIKKPKAGDFALLVPGVAERHGTEEFHPREHFTCFFQPYQKVQVASTPGRSWTKDGGEVTPVIAIKTPDSKGIERIITVNLDQLIFATNDN